MSNDICTLREALFDTLKSLRDKTDPMDIERAKAVSEVAQTIINTAKVEIEHLKATGGKAGTEFIPLLPGSTPVPTNNGTKTVTALPGGSVTQHRMR